MTGRGQGRSYLQRDRPAEGPLVEGRVRVEESTIDLRTVAYTVARMVWSISRAEADDEVQEEAIRAWLSGHGLPADRGLAHRSLVRRVVQRVLSDLAGGRRGRLAAYRRELWTSSAFERRCDAGDADLDGVEFTDLLAAVRTKYGSVSQIEARVDADTVLRIAHDVAGRPRKGRDPRARAVVLLIAATEDVRPGGWAGDPDAPMNDAAIALCVSRSAVHSAWDRLVERIRARLRHENSS